MKFVEIRLNWSKGSRFFLRFGPMNFFFQLLELRKIRKKNWGEPDSLFGVDVTNKIIIRTVDKDQGIQ